MSKTALVTGASRGIGLETTRRFILNNDDITTVVMCARDSEDFDHNVAELEKELPIGRRIVPIKVDVGDRPALKAAIEQAHDTVGNIDVLVNNAGYTNPVPLQQVDMDDFEKTINVNLYGPFTIVQTLLNRGNTFGLIVNIASTAGINGRSGWLTYSASKAAVINMSQVMREELAIYGTRVVCLSPGRTATDLRKTLAPDEDPSTIMQPEHVAQVINTMSSPVG
ncbi:MAG: SDR family oxidoreductase, partial [Brachybacterium sp.]|uniref:SDR family NAD(P)-dependent oxidoreductase n=1 Tax=Brachybacterium sp. TaxID=1891286 RepID=UPI002646FC7A